jgi:hypothetical protein
MNHSISVHILYFSFVAWNGFMLLVAAGLAFWAFNWALSQFIRTYTCVQAIREAYRQGRDPFWPFWRRKAREMKRGDL